jgi:hypothetical protein
MVLVTFMLIMTVPKWRDLTMMRKLDSYVTDTKLIFTLDYIISYHAVYNLHSSISTYSIISSDSDYIFNQEWN